MFFGVWRRSPETGGEGLQFIKIMVEFVDKNNCLYMWSPAADPLKTAWEGTADIPPATADPPNAGRRRLKLLLGGPNGGLEG